MQAPLISLNQVERNASRYNALPKKENAFLRDSLLFLINESVAPIKYRQKLVGTKLYQYDNYVMNGKKLFLCKTMRCNLA